MRYREKLEKYKEKSLPPEELEQVEADIEKQDAISEFLTERMEEELLFGAENEGGQQDGAALGENKDGLPKAAGPEKDFEAYVKKSIHRSFRKMGMGICGAILAVVLFIQFGLSSIVSKLYYNPGKEIRVTSDGGNSYVLGNQMSRDFSIYSEVNFPGKIRDIVRVLPLGYGKYDITLDKSVVYAGAAASSIGGRVTRGQLTLYDAEYLKMPSSNLFANRYLEENPEKTYEEQLIEQDKRGEYSWYWTSLDNGREHINRLKDGEIYQAYVTLSRRLTFKEMQYLLSHLCDDGLTVPHDLWQAVCLGPDNAGMKIMGYDYQDSPRNLMLSEEEEKRYPELSFMKTNAKGDADWETIWFKRKNERDVTEHFKSMLRYIMEHRDFLKMMGEASGEFRGKEGLEMAVDIYESAIRYIEDNGLQYFGFVCYSDKAGLQKMLEKEEILAIAAIRSGDGEI